MSACVVAVASCGGQRLGLPSVTPTPPPPTQVPAFLPGSTTASPDTFASLVCHAANLSATYEWQGATGSLLGEISLTNRGPEPCTISGYLGVKLIGRDGAVLPVTDSTEPALPGQPSVAPQVVVLAPNVTGAATAQLQWREWCAATNPTPVSLSLTLSDGSVLTAPFAGGDSSFQTPRCDAANLPSSLGVGPIAPKPSA